MSDKNHERASPHDPDEPARQREVLESLCDAAEEGIAIHEKGVILASNRAYARMFGYEPDEVISMRVLDFAAPESAALVEQNLLQGHTHPYEAMGKRKDGSTFPGELIGRKLSFRGRPCRVTVIRDVTERRLASKALRESEELYRTLVETCPDGITLADLEGRVIAANLQAASMYGCDTVEELLAAGMNVFDLVAEEERDRARSFADKALKEGTVRGLEYRVVRADGSYYPAEINASVVRNADGNPRGFIGVIRDITERKRAEEERRRLQAQVLHAQKLESLGVLAGGIAHDFNNLLMGVLGNASLALLELEPGTDIRGYIEKIEQTAQHAAELTKQMLAYSGKGKFVVQAVDLSRLVEEMAHLLRISISKRASLRLDCQTGIAPIEADATQIRQVVMNLITNASDACQEQGGTISVSTGMFEADRAYLSGSYLDEDLEEGSYVYLEVADSGTGMDGATRNRIFDPFFTTKFTGRGLGLAAVLGIVRGHRGAIRVESRPGEGTTFTVLFRAITPVQQPREKKIRQPRSAASGTTILVVDDEATVRDVTRSMLETTGYRVLTAADGMECIETFEHHREEIALVLLDTTMPAMDGIECLRALRRIQPDVRVILSSGYDQEEIVSRFRGERAQAFIQKPYRLETLAELVHQTLA